MALENCQRCGAAPYVGEYRTILPGECDACETAICTACSTDTRHGVPCQCAWHEFCSKECRAARCIECATCAKWAERIDCGFCGEPNKTTFSCHHLDCDGGVDYCSPTCHDADGVKEALGSRGAACAHVNHRGEPCIICGRWICNGCAYRDGRHFCSRACRDVHK